MPYKISGNAVYVKKGGKWKLLKRYTSRAKALAYFRALKANVKEH